MSVADQRSPNWIRSKNEPENEKIYGDRLYYFEPGCEYGGKDEDGVMWYRISCSYWFGDWIETQDRSLWRSYGSPHRAIYIIREELLTIIKLRWL